MKLRSFIIRPMWKCYYLTIKPYIFWIYCSILAINLLSFLCVWISMENLHSFNGNVSFPTEIHPFYFGKYPLNVTFERFSVSDKSLSLKSVCIHSILQHNRVSSWICTHTHKKNVEIVWLCRVNVLNIRSVCWLLKHIGWNTPTNRRLF